MKSIHETFKGNEKLWKVFWLYTLVLGWALLLAVDYALTMATFVKGAIYVVALIWLIWISVGLWRCAFNARLKIWGYLARGFVILSIGVLVIEAFGPAIGIDIYP